ncbi:hypothetical protein [Rhizobium deserti]|uniref:hypothetical protein n=1 Tax=Rhizobium deserti TaxID=2547961 RepID=UPI00138766CA|nr:hypothetical protein [Rhizobium deserti]
MFDLLVEELLTKPPDATLSLNEIVKSGNERSIAFEAKIHVKSRVPPPHQKN